MSKVLFSLHTFDFVIWYIVSRYDALQASHKSDEDPDFDTSGNNEGISDIYILYIPEKSVLHFHSR